MEDKKKTLAWVKNIKDRKNPNDKKMTPRELANDLIQMVPFQENDVVLDGFKGKGAFYDQYPDSIKPLWCELDKGKDFFEWNQPVDWVGPTNPPYSKLKLVFEHSVKIAKKGIAFLIGTINLSPNRLELLAQHGFGITHIHLVQVRGWFSKSFFIIAQKNKPNIISYDMRYYEMPSDERLAHYSSEKERMRAYYVKNFQAKLKNFRKSKKKKIAIKERNKTKKREKNERYSAL